MYSQGMPGHAQVYKNGNVVASHPWVLAKKRILTDRFSTFNPVMGPMFDESCLPDNPTKRLKQKRGYIYDLMSQMPHIIF